MAVKKVDKSEKSVKPKDTKVSKDTKVAKEIKEIKETTEIKVKRMSKKTLKIKNRGLNGGDLLIKMFLYNPSNSKLKDISNEEYESFLNTLNALCNDK